jgi:methionyl-tRNA formyltransferase
VRGETKTGVTLFWLDEGMDTGPVFLRKETLVGPDEDAPGLMERLTKLGVEALGEALSEIEAGRIVREPQRGDASTAPLIEKDDARVDFARPASDLHNLVRGFRGWPKAWLQLDGQRVQILRTRVASEAGKGVPGTIVSVDRNGGILVQCDGSSRLWLLDVQPEGKKPVTAADFINGLRWKAGDALRIA